MPKPEKPPAKPKMDKKRRDPEMEPDYENECFVCGEIPTIPLTGMCGPCTFGDADTLNGNW